jgi:hypothetical protein
LDRGRAAFRIPPARRTLREDLFQLAITPEIRLPAVSNVDLQQKPCF